MIKSEKSKDQKKFFCNSRLAVSSTDIGCASLHLPVNYFVYPKNRAYSLA
jgi:hypothetical protein